MLPDFPNAFIPVGTMEQESGTNAQGIGFSEIVDTLNPELTTQTVFQIINLQCNIMFLRSTIHSLPRRTNIGVHFQENWVYIRKSPF